MLPQHIAAHARKARAVRQCFGIGMEKKEIESMTLADLQVGQDAVLRAIGGKGELRHHLLDMGLTPGTEVTLRKVAPMGDPIEVELRGYELTLRLADAAQIEVENIHETDRAQRSESRHAPIPAWVNCTVPPAIVTASWALRSPRGSRCILPWQATRTAAKPLCSISLPALTSM